MNRSDLIDIIAHKNSHLQYDDVDKAIRVIIDTISQALAEGDRVEVRGFGSFSTHYQSPRAGRNPKTGMAVALRGRYKPHFKAGKEMRERVRHSTYPIIQADDGE